jgi:Calx-beta domain
MRPALRSLLLIVVCGGAQSALAQDQTFLYFNSRPGDPIGHGKQFTRTPADGTFFVSRIDAGVEIRFIGATFWYLDFVPPVAANLTPGHYEGSMGYPFQSPLTPGLNVSGDGLGCNTLTGRFTVLEAEYGPTGDVVRFAVDYEQYCDSSSSPLFGSVRINSSVPLGPRLSVSGANVMEGDSGTVNLPFVVALSAPAVGPVTVHYATSDGTATAGSDYGAVSGIASLAAGVTSVVVNVPVSGDTAMEPDETLTLSLSNGGGAPIAFASGTGYIHNDDPYKTFLSFNSQPDDWVGRGQQFTLTPVDGSFGTRPADGGIEVYFHGATWWYLHFVPPAGSTLTPGQYEGALRWPFQSPLTPGLDVAGGNRGCNEVNGRFTVLEAQYGPSGQVERLAVDYEQHCGATPALFGSVRINSSVPVIPRLSVSGASVTEGDSGTANLRFMVALSAPALAPVTVGYQTSDGTATAGSDYDAVSGIASLPVGVTAFEVNVPVAGDTTVEADETLTVSLSNAVGAPIVYGSGTGFIGNDDPYKTLLHFNSQPGEGIGQGRTFTLTPTDGTITPERLDGGVHVQFHGVAFWDLYFIPPSGSPLAPGAYEGATRWPFQSPTTPGLAIGGENRGCNTLTGRFTVLEAEYGPKGQVLRLAVDYEQYCGGVAPVLYGSVRINSSMPPGPQLSVSGANVTETDSGTVNMRFVVALSAPAVVPVTVNYASSDGTAMAGSDYTAVSGIASLAAGVTSVVVNVPVSGDTAIEPDETVILSLTNAVGAPIAFGSGTGFIRNDDPYKTLLYFNSQPGDFVGGGQQFTLTPVDGNITAGPLDEGVQVYFQGATWWDLRFRAPYGGALIPGVYPGARHEIFPSPADPRLSVFTSRGCSLVTGRFSVLEAEYGPSGEVIRFAADYEQSCEGFNPPLFGSVRFNSSVPLARRVAIAGASLIEGDTGSRSLNLPVWLSEPSPIPVTVNFVTANGTAVAGVDYGSSSGSVTVPAGASDAVIPVPVYGDSLVEDDETINVSLTGAVGALVGPLVSAVGVILDDDAVRHLSVNDISVAEGDPWQTVEASFTLSLDAPSRRTVSVSYVTQQGSATVDQDFRQTTGTVQLAPGTASVTVNVPIVSDLLKEANETFALVLSSPSNVVLAQDRGTATIVDDDRPLDLHTVRPCRIIDTRLSGPALGANGSRTLAAAGLCGIPSTAKAVAANVTSVTPTDQGDLRLFPAGTAPPTTSVLNFGMGQTRAANAIVTLGAAGAITVQCDMPAGSSGVTHIVVDVVGYFE